MVMDEKEMLRKIRNSFRVGKSKAHVIEALQNQGYKLEYIDKMINKAEAPKTFIIVSSVILIVLIALGISSYFLFFHNPAVKQEISNPLAGYKIIFSDGSYASILRENQTGDSLTEINISEIKIEPTFISYLMNEIGAWKLHKNKLTGELPIINLEVSQEDFSTKIDEDIETTKSLSEDADMSFVTEKESIVMAMLSENPGEVFKESIQEGETQIETIASETELFAKGYLDLYNELNGE